MKFGLLLNSVRKMSCGNRGNKVPILYSHPHSPGTRAVLIAAKLINVDLEIKEISTAKKDHLTPEFLKLNPQHTIPTLDDNGLILCDSHAIATYLCNKYNPKHDLYPVHPECRSLVDQRLYFDASILFPLYKKCVREIKFNGAYEQAPNDISSFQEVCAVLETFLKGNLFLTGQHLSLADFFCAATLTQMNEILPVDYKSCTSIKDWIDRLSELPDFQRINNQIINEFSPMIKGLIDENRKNAKK